MDALYEVTLLLVAAAIAAPLGKLTRIGSVLAFVAMGVLIGPDVLKLVRNSENILHFAEIGVVFLLFIIGLELQPRRLWALRKLIFGAGTLQLLLSIAALGGLLIALTDFTWQPALVIASGLGLSSTAFALRLLADNRELQTGHGKLAFGVLLFQDLAVIPLLALMPLLAVTTVEDGHSDIPLWVAIGIFIAFVLIAHFLLIPFLRLIAWSRVQEAFTATALLLVIGSALLMEHIGLSMGLGAFLAGVLVADSEYRHQLEADIEPFKGLLLGLFFMAVGMSTNIGLVADAWPTLLAGVLLLIAVKSLVLFGVGRLYRLDNVAALRFAGYLCQGGEFGFVVFTLAGNMAILSADTRDLLIVLVTLSMALTPVVLKVVSLLPGAKPDEKALAAMSLTEPENHPVIIAGFGRFGQILGRVLNAQDIRYTAIDTNPEQVKLVREYGNTVYYGDLSRHAVLETAGVAKAKVLALCIDDIEASLRIVRDLKASHPNMKLFCRARNRQHELLLRDLGVDYVVRETLLSSLEFTRQVLTGMGMAPEKADAVVATFRTQDEKLLRQQAALPADRSVLIQTTKQAALELKNILQNEGLDKPLKSGSGD